VLRTDGYGDTLWTCTLGGTEMDEVASVEETGDGGFIVAGWTWSFGPGFGSNVYLAGLDSGGNVLWTRDYGESSDDEARSVRQTVDGGYVVVGSTGSAGLADVWMLRTDGDGDTLWTRTYGGADFDKGYSVQVAPDNGYIIAGSTSSFGAGSDDVYLVRTDSLGDTLWTRTYGGADFDIGLAVDLTADSGFIITGSTYSFGAGFEDVYLIKTDARGDTNWTRTFGFPYADLGYGVQQTTDGGYVVAGYAEPPGSYIPDAFLLKVATGGETLWTRMFGGAGEDDATSVAQTSDGGYVVAGYTELSGSGDIWLIKTDSLGYVAVPVAEPKASPTAAAALSVTCEPNPFSGVTTISLKPQASSSKPLTLRVYDAQGRVVHSSFDIRTSPLRLDLGSLPAGAYFAVLDCGALHASTRLVMQR
jgi:hypothetical protein